MSLTKLDYYMIQENIETKYNLTDLPIKPYNTKSSTTSLTTAIQIVRDIPNLNWMTRFGDNTPNLDGLQPPFGFHGKGLPPHSLQIYTKPQPGGFTVMSVLTFALRCNAKTLSDAFQGPIYILSMGRKFSPRLAAHLMHYMGTRLGGRSLVNHVLDFPEKKPTKTQASIKDGFSFIKSEGPIGTEANQNVEWTTLQVNDPSSPIYQWNPALVKESLRNLTAGKTVAAAHSSYPLTLKDIRSYILHAIAIPYLKIQAEHGLIMLGLSGIGKTPFSRILALAVSEYNLQRDGIEDGVPSYRCGNDLDFFRLAPGTIYAPAIYDDGPLADDLAAHIKIYIDPSEEEPSFKARWGSCRFEKNQTRLICNNAFDNDAEPPYAMDYIGITHDTFMNMIRVALPRAATHEDLQAICKRAMIVLFGRNRIYIRDPSPATNVRVKVVEYWPDGVRPDLLTDEGVAKLKALRGGDATPSPSHYMDRLWQVEFMKRCIKGEPIPLSYYIRKIYDDNGTLQDMQPFDEKPVFGNIVDPAHEYDPYYRLCGDDLADNGATGSNSHGPPEAKPDADDQDEARPNGDGQIEASPKRARSSPEVDLEYELGRLMEEAPTFNADDAMDAPTPDFLD